MDEQGIQKIVETINYDDLKLFKKEAVRKLSNVRKRDRIYFRIYLQKEFVESFEQAIDWAFNKGLIKRKTRWAFTRFCVVNVISMIMKEIEKKNGSLLCNYSQK